MEQFHQYQVEQTSDRGWILFIDNLQACCPYQPPIVMPPSQFSNGPQVIRLPCSTTCPMAAIKTKETVDGNSLNKQIYYTTSCGAAPIDVVVRDRNQKTEPAAVPGGRMIVV